MPPQCRQDIPEQMALDLDVKFETMEDGLVEVKGGIQAEVLLAFDDPSHVKCVPCR